jgi:hypothetical protein
MVTNKHRLLQAVRLLDDIMAREKGKGSDGSQGSSRVLLIRLTRVRELLVTELERPEPNWSEVVVPLLREVVQWLGEFVIDNLQYLFRPRQMGHAG